MRAPLSPKVDAVLVLDGDGNRLAGKYYGEFLAVVKDETGASTSEARAAASELRQSFENQLQSKMHGMVSRSDAAEVVMLSGKTAVFCGGAMPGGQTGDVRVVIVGSPGESELVLAYFAESMYEALSSLMGGSTERSVVLDNLELVLLLIDELCDGGIILETDSHKLVSSVLLREDDGFVQEQQGMPRANNMGATGMAAGELTIGQALRQAREQLISQLGNQGM